ncbi:MAG: hypothetical protein QXV68_02675 [Candidatus Caldarchaeum sp.]
MIKITMGILSRIREIVAERTGSEAVKVFTPSAAQWPDWRKAYDTYMNPAVATSVDLLTYTTVGPGVYVTSTNEKAKAVVKEWMEKTGFKNLLTDVVREMIITGNSLLTWRDKTLQRIPLTWLDGQPLELDPQTLEPVAYHVRGVIGSRTIQRRIPAEEVVHFRWNRLDPASPWGYGLAYQLITTQTDWKGRIVPSIFDTEATLRRDLVLFMDRSIPKTIVKLDVGDVLFDEKKAEIESVMREPGADFITNMDFKVEKVEAPTRVGFDHYRIFYDMFVAGLKTPFIRLFTTPGFTEASAKEALNLVDHMVRALREAVESVVETRIFPRLVAEHVELHWGQPKLPEYRIEDVLRAAHGDEFNPPIITVAEARHILRELGWILEEGESVGEAYGGKVVDTISSVDIYLCDPSDIDRATVRYYSVDSEKGVYVVAAFLKSVRMRKIAAVVFDKRVYSWTVQTALVWYRESFPTVKLNTTIM